MTLLHTRLHRVQHFHALWAKGEYGRADLLASGIEPSQEAGGAIEFLIPHSRHQFRAIRRCLVPFGGNRYSMAVGPLRLLRLVVPGSFLSVVQKTTSMSFAAHWNPQHCAALWPDSFTTASCLLRGLYKRCSNTSCIHPLRPRLVLSPQT
jgi:hypothetical protein